MLTIQNLEFAYGRKHVLNGLDLTVPEGEVHGILGHNGAGKTTLFRLVAGWLPAPAGAVRWQGGRLDKRQTAFLETAPYFYPYITGEEYLRLIRPDTEGIRQWNRLFDLPLGELVDHYSTGMQKKLAFLGVLLQQRPVMILDEPFNGVDLSGNELMMAILRRKEALSGTILLSSHVLNTLTQVCDRISILRDGRLEKTVERPDFDQLEAESRQAAENLLQQTLQPETRNQQPETLL